jgi:hypothetical protein
MPFGLPALGLFGFPPEYAPQAAGTDTRVLRRASRDELEVATSRPRPLDAIVEAEFKDIKTLGQAGLQETASGHGTPQVACDRRVALSRCFDAHPLHGRHWPFSVAPHHEEMRVEPFIWFRKGRRGQPLSRSRRRGSRLWLEIDDWVGVEGIVLRRERLERIEKGTHGESIDELLSPRDMSAEGPRPSIQRRAMRS